VGVAQSVVFGQRPESENINIELINIDWTKEPGSLEKIFQYKIILQKPSLA
jgi:hypothetical protein